MTGSVNTSTVRSLCNDVEKNTVNNGVTYTREDLEDLFAETQYFNAGEAGKAQIQNQIDKLEATIKTLKKEAEDLQKEVEDKNLKVDKKSNKMAEIAGKINAGTKEYQDGVRNAAKQAAYDAIASYKANGGADSYEVCYESAFKAQLGNIGMDMNMLKALYAEYDNVKNQISPIAKEIEGFLKDIKSIQTRLDNTNATINLLSKTRDNMSDAIQGAYKNVDTDSKAPKFSGAKAELANSLLAQYTSRTKEGTGTGAPKQDAKAAKEKWSAKNNKETKLKPSSYEFKSMDNVELKNLNKCLEDGMIADLQASGMNNNEIMTFIMKNWNVGIKYDAKKDEWTIPKGHENKGVKKGGTAVYDKLRAFCASKTTVSSANNVNQDQMAEMKKAVEKDGILKQMYKAGFTFKEMMYTMTTLFPDAGLTYDLSTQSTRNYGIVSDNSASGTLYKDMAAYILDKWNVGGTAAKEKDNSVTGSTKYDPITFQQGDTTYTFIIDRDGDGQFDYTDGKNNELLGSQKGLEELKDFDYNGDGVIDANDVDKDGNRALDQLLLLGNKQTESISESKDVDGYKKGANYKGKGAYTNSVDFDASYQTAADLGITSINLKDLEAGKKGATDINGSETAASFGITTDGSVLDKEITARETYNTEDNLNTFYGTIAKNAGNIYADQLTKGDVDEAYEKDYNSDVTSTRSILNNMKDNLEALLKQAQELGDEDEDKSRLNYELSDLIELYGENGMGGTYYQTVKQRAINASDRYAQQEKNGVNTGHGLDDQENSNSGLAAKEIDTEIDKYNKSLEVKVINDDEKK